MTIYIKAIAALAIPALSAFTASFAVFGDQDCWPSGPKWVAIGCSTLAAGISGLASYLSRGWSNHVQEQNLSETIK